LLYHLGLLEVLQVRLVGVHPLQVLHILVRSHVERWVSSIRHLILLVWHLLILRTFWGQRALMSELLLSILSELGLQELLLLSLLLLSLVEFSLLPLLSLVLSVILVIRIHSSEASIEYAYLLLEEKLEVAVGLVGVEDSY
jgi:hypothetical protein